MTTQIAHINLARGYRGGERQTELLIRGLAGTEIKQVLVARGNSPLVQRLADVEVEIREVEGLVSSVRATRGVDIVHSHEGRGVYAAWIRSVLSGTPYIITRRVNNPLGSGFITHAAYRRAAFVASVAKNISGLMQQYDKNICARTVHSSASGLTADRETSLSIRDEFPGKWLVGNIAALDNQQKGQEYVISVARSLQYSHRDIQFLLVGAGDDEAMLRETATDLPNLVFTGFVENVADYLAAFDLFILPSNKEGIGSILIDAMEQGLPIVASRVGGVPEIVHDSDNGLLIEAGATDQLQEAILHLHGDADLCRTMGDRGRQFARELTAEVMCGKYLALYKEALNGKNES